MPKNLVIVESPAKAKTIEGYLGKDYLVKSSYGHVRDLPKDDMAVDPKNGFRPTYEVTADKRDVVAQLKKLAREAETIWLATDDDREGEAISWHLKEALGLQDDQTRRIVFREITKTAILRAINSPRGIDIDLVNAQQARRVLDRLVGFELSPVLWKKVRTGLSAGRVQSVAVRIVVDREREIDQFNTKSSFKVTARFQLPGNKVLDADLPKRFPTVEEATAFVKRCVGAGYFIRSMETKPGKKSPAPPFTTSTLQQEASRKLSFSVSQTMTLAQKLYEAGHITYMRTDSLNLSDDAIGAASQAITGNYGPEYVQTRRFKTKSASAQEAHEAIRPTHFDRQTVGGDRGQQRLYELIWKRAIASQMADAKLEKTTVQIGIEERTPQQPPLPDLVATGQVIKFDGFLKVYIESRDDDEGDEEQAGMLPPLALDQRLDLEVLKATERFSRPPARFTEASLVKKLEEMGIGRPSTYAPTISTIQKRNYVVKESRDGKERSYRELELKNDQVRALQHQEVYGSEKAKLFPTDLAMIVNDFLVQHFPNVVDYSFTANIEKDFDEIAGGRVVWNEMIGTFYEDFHPKVERTGDIERASVGTQRELGVDPQSGKPIIARLGRYGPMVQRGDSEAEEKPDFASLRKDQRLDSITLEQALELFKLPREVGAFEDKPVVAAIGRFGPYLRHDGKFTSIPKEEDPLAINLERAAELIREKRKTDAERTIKTFDADPDVQVLKGRWGPYIKAGKQNVKIPKDKDPTTLTLEECLKLAEEAPVKRGRGGAKAKTATEEKKPATKKKAPAKKPTAKKTTTKKAAPKRKAKK
ncbi:MAG: type I DNA topoisomerase [Catalinimonas sp.]